MLHADLDTLQQVRVVLAEAMEKGFDAAEALDRAGLLAFKERDNRIVVDTMNHVAHVVDTATITQIATQVQERAPTSPLDTKRQIVALLRQEATG